MASSNNVETTSLGYKGQKKVRSTSIDNSSYGEKNISGINNNAAKGNGYDISSSVVDGKVRKIP